MQLHQQDIIERRERDGRKVLWLSERLLETVVGVSAKYLRVKARRVYLKTVPNHRRKQHIMPDTQASWRWGKINGSFYYDYDRLPDNRREILPSKKELVQLYEQSLAKSRQEDIEIRIKRALKADYRRFIAQYADYSDEKCYALSKAAAIIQAAAEYVRQNDIPTHRNYFFEDLAEVVDRIGVRYVPCNYRRIKQKVLPVIEGTPAHEVIGLPREGNNNAKKYGDKEVLSWLIQLRAHPANYTNEHIIRKVRMLCYTGGKKTPSRSWFASYLAQPEVKWLTQDRFGSGRHRNQHEQYIKTAGAAYSGDCWQVDGTRVNFLPYKDEDGRMRYLYIVAIIDVHSGDLIGWHFDVNERHEAYVNALAMACNNAGYLPYEIVFDQFPGHNTQQWQSIQQRLEKLDVKVTYTSLKTGKAKIERAFGTLQTVFMNESDYYYGEGVQSKREAAHRSPEYLKKQSKVAREVGWSFSQAVDEAERIIELYRTTPYSKYSRKYAKVTQSPVELHKESDKPYVVQVQPWQYAELFWLEKAISIRRGVIQTRIDNQDFVYELPDTVATGVKKVRIMYDLDELDKVYIFEDSDAINREYLGEGLTQKAVQIYGPHADMEAMAKRKARIKAREEARKQKLEQIKEDSEYELAVVMAGLTSKDEMADAEGAWLDAQVTEPTGYKLLNKQSVDSSAEDDDDEDIDLITAIRNQY